MRMPFSYWGLPEGVVLATRTLTPTDHYAAVKVATISHVDWGDGSPVEQAAANTQLNHDYAATSGDVTVRVTAVAPVAMNPNLSVKHPTSTAVDAGWSEIMIRDPHMVDFTVKPNSLLKKLHILGRNQWKPHAPTNFNSMPSVEDIEIDSYLASTVMQSICSGNTGLKRFTCLTPANGIGIDYAFDHCASLESINWDISKNVSSSYAFRGTGMNPMVLDLPEILNMDYMLSETKATTVTLTSTSKATTATKLFATSSVATVNRLDLSSLLNGNGLFQNCKSLVNCPGYSGEKTTDTSYMFYGCSLLEAVGDIGMANVTNTTQMFTACPKVHSLTLRGLKVSIAINGMQLNGGALDAIFTSLGTAVAGATINITGNPGAAMCTRGIATAKGWGVTG